VNKAVKTIKELVRPLQIHAHKCLRLIFPLQMAEYRARTCPDNVRPRPLPMPAAKRFGLGKLAQRYGVADMLDFSSHDACPIEQTIDEEFLAYTTAAFEQTEPGEDADILAFWEVSIYQSSYSLVDRYSFLKANETRFPTFFAIAMDYLPIQASAVPCERVFSSSAETDTKRRNRIHPVLMEALQMLKFSMKQKRLNFTDGWITHEADMQDSVEDTPDLLAVLSTGDKNRVDEVIAAVGQHDEDL
jgi:hAT family C-terminal dimerisation region